VGQDIAINIPSQQSTDFPINTTRPPVPPVAQPQPAPVVQEEIHAAPVAPAPAVKVVEAKPEMEAPKKKEKPVEKAKEVADSPKESKPASKVPEAQHGSYVVLLGSFLSEANAKQRQAKLKDLGVKFYLEKIKSPAGEKTAVRAGPYSSRQEAERALAKLKAAGIADGMVTEKK
jgi:DedD protein